MRRKSERVKDKSSDKKAEKSPKKSRTRSTRRRKKSSSTSPESSDAEDFDPSFEARGRREVAVVTPDEEKPSGRTRRTSKKQTAVEEVEQQAKAAQVPLVEESPSPEEVVPDKGEAADAKHKEKEGKSSVWQVKSADDSSGSEIKKLKLCIVRPPENEPAPRKRKKLSRSSHREDEKLDESSALESAGERRHKRRSLRNASDDSASPEKLKSTADVAKQVEEKVIPRSPEERSCSPAVEGKFADSSDSEAKVETSQPSDPFDALKSTEVVLSVNRDISGGDVALASETVFVSCDSTEEVAKPRQEQKPRVVCDSSIEIQHPVEPVIAQVSLKELSSQTVPQKMASEEIPSGEGTVSEKSPVKTVDEGTRSVKSPVKILDEGTRSVKSTEPESSSDEELVPVKSTVAAKPVGDRTRSAKSKAVETPSDEEVVTVKSTVAPKQLDEEIKSVKLAATKKQLDQETVLVKSPVAKITSEEGTVSIKSAVAKKPLVAETVVKLSEEVPAADGKNDARGSSEERSESRESSVENGAVKSRVSRESSEESLVAAKPSVARDDSRESSPEVSSVTKPSLARDESRESSPEVSSVTKPSLARDESRESSPEVSSVTKPSLARDESRESSPEVSSATKPVAKDESRESSPEVHTVTKPSEGRRVTIRRSLEKSPIAAKPTQKGRVSRESSEDRPRKSSRKERTPDEVSPRKSHRHHESSERKHRHSGSTEAAKSEEKAKPREKVALKRSTSSRAGEEEVEKPPRKRKWGGTSKKPVLSISTDSLKTLIPEAKPLAISEVELTEEEEEKEEGEVERDDEVEAREVKLVFPVATEQRVVQRTISLVGMEARSPSPARNRTSAVLCITNLTRPFTVNQLKELLARTGTILPDGFWTNVIRSKCYVEYTSEEEARETRRALHGVRWPVSNPKQLCVDYARREDLEQARNLTQEPPVVRKKEVEPRPEPRIAKLIQLAAPVREWDLGKTEMGLMERERARSHEKERRIRKHRSTSPREAPARKVKKEEDAPAKLLDDLFRKTKLTPCIYWLPLTADQIVVKEEMRRKHMAEHARRIEEMRKADQERHERMQGRRGGGHRSSAKK